MRKPKIVLFEPDLMFSSKIEATAKRLNVELKVVTDFADLSGDVDASNSKVLLISLDSVEGKSATLKKFVDEGVTVIGYYSHVNAHLREEAEVGGLHTVFSRGAFVGKMEEIFLDISRSD